MQHLKSFDELNEGILQRIKDFIFTPVYRISFKVTHKRGKGHEKTKDGKELKPGTNKGHDHFKPQHKYLDIKAKDEGEAEDKFDAMLSKELRGVEPQPEVEIISVHKVKRIEHKTLKLH